MLRPAVLSLIGLPRNQSEEIKKIKASFDFLITFSMPSFLKTSRPIFVPAFPHETDWRYQLKQ